MKTSKCETLEREIANFTALIENLTAMKKDLTSQKAVTEEELAVLKEQLDTLKKLEADGGVKQTTAEDIVALY